MKISWWGAYILDQWSGVGRYTNSLLLEVIKFFGGAQITSCTLFWGFKRLKRYACISQMIYLSPIWSSDKNYLQNLKDFSS